MRRSQLLAGAGLLALAAALPMGAHAQAGGATAVDEVVVTAQRREQTLIQVPYNISAVSGEEIERSQILDNAELIRTQPGVSVIDRGYRNQGVVTNIQIRGLNVDSNALGDYAVSSVAPVSTYVNDTPLFAGFLLKDLQRVEILRGPQGTLYGSGSLGGTVRYITREPHLGEFSAEANASASSTEGSGGVGWTGDVVVNLPLGDKAALRVVGSVVDLPGVVDYVNIYQLDSAGIPVAPGGVLSPAASYESVKDADTVSIWMARAALRLEPTDNWDLTFTYAQQSDDVGGRRQVTRGKDGYGRQYGDYENGSVQLEPSSREVKLASFETNVDLGFATLTSSTSWFDHEGDSVSENTGFYAKAGFLSFYYNYPRPMASAVRSYHDTATIEELRLVSKEGGRFDYVAGAFYQNETRDSTQDSYLRGFKRWWDAAFPAYSTAVCCDQDFLYARHEEFTETALFGELTFHATDRLQITGGVRQFWDDARNVTDIDLPAYPSLSQPVRAVFETSDSKMLFKGNISYEIDPETRVYGVISQGYRRGGANAVPTTGNFAESPAWQIYGPDTVINYELGLKGRRGGQSFTAALFYIDWDDVQLNTATPFWGFYTVANGQGARSMGVETQLEGRLAEPFHYSLGYTFTDAELTEDFFSPDPLHTRLGRAGDRLPGAPEHIVNVAGDYSQTLWDDMSLVWRLSGYYQSSTRNALGIPGGKYNVELPGFSLWNASVTLGRDKWYASLFIKNIFNNDGVTGRFTEAYMGTSPGQGYYGNASKDFISLPRTIGVSVNYKF